MAGSPPPPSLPSPAYLVLAPALSVALSPELLSQVAKCVATGAWQVDPNEVDPRTGLSLLQALVRHQGLADNVRAQAVEMVAGWGALVDAPAPDGQTAWQWATQHKEWDLARQLERLGARPGQEGLTATQRELRSELERLVDSWKTGPQIVATLAAPEGFGSLDALVPSSRAGTKIPLGLLPLWRHLNVNGADLRGQQGTPEQRSKDLDGLVSTLSSMGKAALAREPASDFPLWCWLTLSQLMFLATDTVSASRQKKRASGWAALERAIARSRYPGMAPDRATKALGHDATRLVAATLDQLVSTAPPLRLAGLVASAVLALRAWTDQATAAAPELFPPRQEALWHMAAAVTRALPVSLWNNEEFSKRWSSPLYYALRPSLDGLLRENQGFPDWVDSPWLTVASAMYRYPGDDQSHQERLLEWMVAHPSTPQDSTRGLAILADRPAIQARARQALLDANLTPFQAAPAAAPRMRM